LALGEELFTDKIFAKCSSPSAALGEAFAKCKVAFAKCPRHLAKSCFPVVNLI
jgi:hypothetical protein